MTVTRRIVADVSEAVSVLFRATYTEVLAHTAVLTGDRDSARDVVQMTVYRLIHSGELPAVRVGRAFHVPAQTVLDYAAVRDTARLTT